MVTTGSGIETRLTMILGSRYVLVLRISHAYLDARMEYRIRWKPPPEKEIRPVNNNQRPPMSSLYQHRLTANKSPLFPSHHNACTTSGKVFRKSTTKDFCTSRLWTSPRHLACRYLHWSHSRSRAGSLLWSRMSTRVVQSCGECAIVRMRQG